MYMKARACVILAGMLLLLALSFTTALADEKPAEAAVKPAEAAENPPLAKFGDKTITLSEIIEAAQYRSGGRFNVITPDVFLSMNAEQREAFVKDHFFMDLLAREAEEAGFDKEAKTKDLLDMIRGQILASRAYIKEVREKIPEPAEEELKQYYEDNKERFTQPFTFKMRHIFISTYKSYETKEGDTLEGIAETISGDPKMVEFILTNDEVKQERYVKPEDRQDKVYQPLEPGEKLLVPMTSTEQAGVKKQIEQIYADLKNGADFLETARKHSQSGENSGDLIGPIVPSRDKKPMLPEVLEAIKKTPSGQFSEIVKTKHGYNIFKVEEKKEERLVPLDEVRDNLRRALVNERAKDFSNEALIRIVKETPGITVNENVFSDDKASSDAVIISVGDKAKFTLADYKSRIPEMTRSDFKNDRERLLSVITSRQMILPIMSQFAAHKGIDKDPEFVKQYEQARIQNLAESWLRQITASVAQPSGEAMKKYFEENKDRYKMQRQVDISIIGLRFREFGVEQTEEQRTARIAENKKVLENHLPNLKTREDFENLAGEISQDATRNRKGAVGFVTSGYRNGFGGRLETIKRDEIIGPVEQDDFVYLVRCNDVQDEKMRTFEEVQSNLEMDLSAEMRARFLDEKKSGLFEKAGFEMLMK